MTERIFNVSVKEDEEQRRNPYPMPGLNADRTIPDAGIPAARPGDMRLPLVDPTPKQSHYKSKPQKCLQI
jgi:hypothetical protein